MPSIAYRDRVEACNEVLAKVLADQVRERERVVEMLKESYEAREIQPLRGWSAHDLYDKEMALLYALGKYGLGLSTVDYPFLASVFSKEIVYEEAYRDILAGRSVKEAVESRLGGLTQEGVFRVLRMAVSLVVLGFEPEDNLAKAFHRVNEELEALRSNLFSFMRFYVALRTAEQIASGSIKSRGEKEAFKLSLCIRMGAPNMAPPDDLVKLISRLVFRIPERRLTKLFSSAKPAS